METVTEPLPVKDEAAMPWRSPKVFIPVGIIVLLLVSGGIFLGLRQRQSSPQNDAASPSLLAGATGTGTPTAAVGGLPAVTIVPDNVTITPRVLTAVPTSVNAYLFTNPSEPAYIPGKGLSPDALRVVDIVTLQEALELYRVANKRYPPTLAALFPTYAPKEGNTKLTEPPTDPETHRPYDYQPSADGATYHIAATLSSGKQYTGIIIDSP